MSTSLSEKLRGVAGITAIVDDIVEAHMNSPSINTEDLKWVIEI